MASPISPFSAYAVNMEERFTELGNILRKTINATISNKKGIVIFMDFIIFSFLFCSGEISLPIEYSFMNQE